MDSGSTPRPSQLRVRDYVDTACEVLRVEGHAGVLHRVKDVPMKCQVMFVVIQERTKAPERERVAPHPPKGEGGGGASSLPSLSVEKYGDVRMSDFFGMPE